MPALRAGHHSSVDRFSGRLAARSVFVVFGLALFGTFLSGCTLFGSPEPHATLGIAPGRIGYVPARIAIMACQPWPNGARFEDLPMTSANAQEIEKLCAALDAATLAAFNGQPYMRGYPPKIVERELEKAGKKNLGGELAGLFAHGPDSCLGCGDVANYYSRTIAPRQAWRVWLSGLGKAAKNADAALFPFLTYAYAKHYSDRGLAVAERAVGAALLLVDTETGELIWAGGREAMAPNRRLEAERPIDPKNELKPPPWEDAMTRLLTADLWRDFPGRQIY